MIIIPQRDDTLARFPRSAGEGALVNLMDRLGAWNDTPPEAPADSGRPKLLGGRVVVVDLRYREQGVD
jgi:hypothetical protein